MTAPSSSSVRELRRFAPARVIVEPPPPRLLLVLPSLVAALVLALVTWAGLSRVDIVTTATGRIVPSSRVKVVQPLETAVVRDILVREGMAVTAGTPVIVLDPVETNAERERLEGERWVTLAEVARLRALLGMLGRWQEPAPPLDLPAAMPAEVAAAHRQWLDSQWSNLVEQVELAEREVARFTAVLAANATQQDKAQAVLAVLRERMGIRDALTGRDLMPRSQLLELRQTLVEHEQELAVLAATRQQIESERQAAAVRRRQLEAEARERLAAELAQKERALGTVTQELRKAKAREARRTLRAPVDGVVVDLAAHTVGGVAKEAEPLLRLVPEDAPLEVEALLAPRDIGFIRPGQPVTVKVDAFPYVRYGTLEGRVIDVPADASGGGDPGQPVYRVRVALERRELTVEGAAVALTAGMTVTADIRTGERGVLDYLLDPLLRYRHESLRER